MCSPIAPQIICIDQFYFPTFELDIGMGNCTGPVSATLFIYLRYIGDNTNSSLTKVLLQETKMCSDWSDWGLLHLQRALTSV